MADWWQSIFPGGRQTLWIEEAGGERVAIAYGEAGSGQPLIFLHGIGSWSYSWRYNVEPLAQHCRVICLDAVGHGFSQPALSSDIVGHQITELVRQIEVLCDQPAILVGESLGALTALAVAESHPDWVDRLVLINVPIFPKQLPNVGMQSLANLPIELVRSVDQFQLVRPFSPLVRALTWMARHEVVADPSMITAHEIHWLTYPYIEFPGRITQFALDLRQAAQEIYRHLQQEPNLIQTIQDNLPRVACPTLILWGDQDRWFPSEDGAALHARLPQSRFQILSNCGHNSSTSSVQVNAEILGFLRETGSLR